MFNRRTILKGTAAVTGAAAAGLSSTLPSAAQKMDAAKKWVETEFQPSTLAKDAQMAEMEWFMNAAKPFAGLKLSCVSESLKVHDYESQTLTKASTLR